MEGRALCKHNMGQCHVLLVQLTFASEPIRRGSFVPNSRDIVYSADIGGNEQYQLFRREASTGASTMLTDGVHRHSGPVWSHDGSRFAWSNNARNGKDTDVWVMNPDVPGDAVLVGPAEGAWYATEWSQIGRAHV